MKHLIQTVDRIFDEELDNYTIHSERDTRTTDCLEIRILIEEDYIPSRTPHETIPPDLEYNKILVRDKNSKDIFKLIIHCSDDTSYIHKIWIDNEYRRYGISKNIIRQISQHFASSELSDVVSVPLTRAGKELLKSCGFIRTKRKNGKDILVYKGLDSADKN